MGRLQPGLQPELENAQVAIVGLGLMGGSLAGALRGRCQTVTGVARRPEVIEVALSRGLVDRGPTAAQRQQREGQQECEQQGDDGTDRVFHGGSIASSDESVSEAERRGFCLE